MTATVSKWGNSQGIRLPKSVTEALGIDVGQKVELIVRDGELVLKPIKRKREKLDIRELVKQISADYETQEVFDDAMGKEVW